MVATKEKREVRLAYTIAELATLMPRSPTAADGLYDKRTVVRWLKKAGVPINRLGRDDFVWLGDLFAGIPEFREALARSREVEE